MTTPHARPQRLTLEECLRFENAHLERHEFVAGEVYAMTGAALRHSHIVQNPSFQLARRPGFSLTA